MAWDEMRRLRYEDGHLSRPPPSAYLVVLFLCFVTAFFGRSNVNPVGRVFASSLSWPRCSIECRRITVRCVGNAGSGMKKTTDMRRRPTIKRHHHHRRTNETVVKLSLRSWKSSTRRTKPAMTNIPNSYLGTLNSSVIYEWKSSCQHKWTCLQPGFGEDGSSVIVTLQSLSLLLAGGTYNDLAFTRSLRRGCQ